jgi:UDP-N-acetylglucosamine:LPS N-acetylglucosamine transferase
MHARSYTHALTRARARARATPARVLQNGVGRYSTNPKAIASQVAAWCGPEAGELAAMARKAKALGRPNATFRIVKDLAALTKA